MDKENCYIHTMEVIQRLKNEITKFSGKLMELEALILAKVTQTQEDKRHIFSHFWISFEFSDMCVLLVKSIEIRKVLRN